MPEPNPHAASWAGYAEQAESLIDAYESVGFERKFGGLLGLLPKAPARVLDIGAGTGADAAWLAERGHPVTAVEPVAEFRDAGQRLHAGASIVWLDEHLPDLAGLAPAARFDLVLLTAVWMHLDEAERKAGMARLAGLLSPQGLIVMTLRHGPVPAGRRMFAVSAADTLALANLHGLVPAHLGQRESLLSGNLGAGVTWSVLALRHAPAA